MPLQLQELSKDFGSFRLEPINLQIERGEFFCLLGPSGCGKTTVLRLIGGFEQPSSGRVILKGADITRQPPHKRNIHTVFQRYALFPHLTVYENVAFSLRLKGVSKAELDARVCEILKLVEIEDLKSRKTHQISGGQSQRVALSRALVDHPDVLLLDEPLSALDPSLRTRMREELKTLCRKVGVTFVMVTHDQEEALQLSDRIAILKNGVCLQVGTPKAIYEDPTDGFVAEFIGPVNRIAGEITQEQDIWLLKSKLGNFKIKKSDAPFYPNSELLLRPEKMRILRQRSQTQDNILEGEILDLTYLGNRTEYTVKAGGQTFKVFEQELERAKKRLLNVKDKIYMSWRPDDSILLPLK